MYPVVFFDALRVKIRDDGVVSKLPATTHRHQAILQEDRAVPAPPVALQCEPAPLS